MALPAGLSLRIDMVFMVVLYFYVKCAMWHTFCGCNIVPNGTHVNIKIRQMAQLFFYFGTF